MAKISTRDYQLHFGALYRRTETSMIVIHHTGNPHDDDLSAEEIHNSHKNQGWAGIGYHYVIRKDGTIEYGRPEEMIGSHAYGYNYCSVGIHVCGNFEIAEPTKEQLGALPIVIADICKRYGLIASKDIVVAHRDLMATACVPLDTELLTPDGWVKLRNLNLGDLVACPHLDDLSVEFLPIQDFVPISKRDTYTVHGLTATKDHRLVYSLPKTSNVYKIETYGMLLNSKSQPLIPLAANGGGSGLDVTDDELKLLIATQADGNYKIDNRNKNTMYYGVQFHFKKDRKIARLKDILRNLEIQYCEYTKKDGSVVIHFNDYPKYGKVMDFFEKYLTDKKFNWGWLNLDQKQAKLFLKEILLWDGCTVAKKYTSKEKINLDVVNAIASINGVASRISDKDVFFRDNPYTTLLCEQKRNKPKDVSCVRVATGVILVRQNGKTFVIGNCPGNNLYKHMQEIRGNAEWYRLN